MISYNDPGAISTVPASYNSLPMTPQRIVVACDHPVTSGGLLRFARVGAVLRDWGHTICLLPLGDRKLWPDVWNGLHVLSLAQAEAQNWDAVMVPGAGFSDAVIEDFDVLRQPGFGLRVQHILNDQTRRNRFEKVNSAFAPQLVIFNNTAWPVGSFTSLQADRFHILQGAVDTLALRPPAYRSHPLTAGRWVVGGLANKNPQPLLDALPKLPDDVIVRLYGEDRQGLATSHAALVAAGQLELVGPLTEAELPAFYRSVDCVVMTETFAGWSNLVAEAMASALPVVCTHHGTGLLACNGETALVLDEPTPAALAAGISRLCADPALCGQLAEAARNKAETLSWTAYANSLLRLLPHDDRKHYAWAPKLGLYGKWPHDTRMAGLAPLLDRVEGLTAVDFGAAEGLIARDILRHGARSVHGFELDADRVAVANALCSDWPHSWFKAANLGDWEAFLQCNGHFMDASYDVVLFLGLYHHLPATTRRVTLVGAARLARRLFVVRTPTTLYETDSVDDILAAEDLYRIPDNEEQTSIGEAGSLRLYERLSA